MRKAQREDTYSNFNRQIVFHLSILLYLRLAGDSLFYSRFYHEFPQIPQKEQLVELLKFQIAEFPFSHKKIFQERRTRIYCFTGTTALAVLLI